MARKLISLILFLFLGGVLPIADAVATTTVTLTDMAGRKVQVPAELQRIVPLGAATRFMVYMQSLDLAVGLEALESKWATSGRPYGLVTLERAKKLPVVGEGGPGRLPDFEKIISVRPDLILAMGIDVEQVENIQKKTGIPIFVLSYGTMSTIDMGKIKEALRTLGKLLRHDDRAEKLIGYIESLEKDLAQRTTQVTDRAKSYVGAVSYMGLQPITSTESNFVPLSWAGGDNVADGSGREGHLFIDPEQLLAWDPDNIFIDAGGLTKVADDYRKNPDFYHRLKAVKDNRVFLVMPYNNYYTNIEITLADAWYVGKVLYPDRFIDIDPAVKADEIFQFFLGIPAYRELQKEYQGFGRVQFERDKLVIH